MIQLLLADKFVDHGAQLLIVGHGQMNALVSDRDQVITGWCRARYRSERDRIVKPLVVESTHNRRSDRTANDSYGRNP